MSETTRDALPLDPEGFRSWLTARHATAYVGKARVGDDDPLARYLRERLGGDVVEVAVNYDEIYVTPRKGLSRSYPTPGWAVRFARAIDDRHYMLQPVTAGFARQLLDEVLRGGDDQATVSPTVE